MPREWSAEEIMTLGRSYQQACVLAAAADLDVFTALADGPRTAEEVAAHIRASPRGTSILLDALAAIELIDKTGHQYSISSSVADALSETGSRSALAIARHQAACLRSWARLAWSVRSGTSVEREPGIRGEQADRESFIEAMDNVNVAIADQVVADLQPISFNHLLDVGGASGTWAFAWLRARPQATATIFDLPHAIELAEVKAAKEGLADRITLVAGDFYVDPLPEGGDLAWVSAIVHQNSREQNRRLFASVHQALEDGGRILIRDMVMDESRTSPPAGALFAINMLVNTEAGGTFTFAELASDLEASGFGGPALVRDEPSMNAVISAEKRP
ncbi:MAG: methyltransferase [Planctomycetota bacterium]|nr:methyltransferase [Planctomycetota bacterium]